MMNNTEHEDPQHADALNEGAPADAHQAHADESPLELPRRRHGRRRDRRSSHGRGDVKSAVIALLVEQPRHGYELIQEISARTDGAWQPSPGSVYPTIAALQDGGLVRVNEDDSGRRVVTLTEAGSTYAGEHADDLERVFETTGRSRGNAHRDLISGMRAVAAATKQVAQVGTPVQAAEAARLLQDTKRALYAILAEVPTDGEVGDADSAADSDTDGSADDAERTG